VELSSARRIFLVALVVSMCATAALAVGILLFSEFGETSARILGTTGALAFFSLLALPAGVLLDRGRAAVLGWVSLALAALGLVLVLVLLWVDWDDGSEKLGKSALTVTVFAVAGAQASATTARLREEDPRSVRWLYAAGLAAVAALASMTAVAVWAEIDQAGYYRVLGALAIVAVLVTLLQPVLRKTAAPGTTEPGGFRLRLTLADGHQLEREERARTFADAVAKAVRAAEREGSRVMEIERLEAGPGPS
jgi:MFS family permease